MQIQRFLEHHGIKANPFADEDAQTDLLFKEHCIDGAYHPAWDKVYGDPSEPATSIVFGEKGAGKTAMRLQIVRHLEEANRRRPDDRLFVIEYDDFNPFLDRFRERFHGRRRREERVLKEWKLWDHMDAILSLGTTKLVDWALEANGRRPPDEGLLRWQALDRLQARDLLLLAACYDQTPSEGPKERWRRLRRKLGFQTWKAKLDVALGIAVMLAVLGVIAGFGKWGWLLTVWPYLIAVAGWGPWLWRAWKRLWQAFAIARRLRVVTREITPLRQVLMHFTAGELAGQPLPNKDRTDDRYELLVKFQNVLKTLGFSGIFVLVDRVDEPHLINGSIEQMRDLLWPMLDNKFLKHPGIGFKLLLPIELAYHIDREDRQFFQRARLDKQNLIPSLEWTGEALFDLANARLRACALDGSTPSLRDLFAEGVTDRRLIEALRGLRVPRNLFRFLYRLLAAHVGSHTDDEPAWRISRELFESTLAVYEREQDAVERGLKAG